VSGLPLHIYLLLWARQACKQSGRKSRYKWGKKTEFYPSVIYVTNPKKFYVAVAVVRILQIVQWLTREFWQKWGTVSDWLTDWLTDWGWLLCLTCLCDWYVLLQCVGIITLILTVKLIFSQSKQLQGLSTLLFFYYFQGLVIWKDNA
jgi:hypothetical protein